MKVTVERFLTLLQEAKQYQSSKKSIDEWKDKEEFVIYRLMFTDNIFYYNRQKYWKLLQSFLNGTLTIKNFCNEWGDISEANKKEEMALEQTLELNDFKFDEEAIGFSLAVNYFDSVMFEFNPNKNLLIKEGMTDEMYRLFFQKNLLPRIAPYCEES